MRFMTNLYKELWYCSVHLRVAAGELLVQILLPEGAVPQVGEDWGQVMMRDVVDGLIRHGD